MKKLLSIALCAIVVVCFSGCVVANVWGSNAVSGTGNLETFNYNVGNFNSLRVEGFCEIRYYSAPSDTVKLEVQANLHEHYVVEVIDNELIVRTKKPINVSRGKTPVLTVSTPVLNGLNIQGAATFTAYDKITADSFRLNLAGAGSGKAELDVNTLNADLSGAGSFELSGRAEKVELSLAGAGTLNAFSLQAREAAVNLAGAGTIEVNSSEKLSVRASGAGSILYKGSPTLDLSTSGVVRIRKAD